MYVAKVYLQKKLMHAEVYENYEHFLSDLTNGSVRLFYAIPEKTFYETEFMYPEIASDGIDGLGFKNGFEYRYKSGISVYGGAVMTREEPRRTTEFRRVYPVSETEKSGKIYIAKVYRNKELINIGFYEKYEHFLSDLISMDPALLRGLPEKITSKTKFRCPEIVPGGTDAAAFDCDFEYRYDSGVTVYCGTVMTAEELKR